MQVFQKANSQGWVNTRLAVVFIALVILSLAVHVNPPPTRSNIQPPQKSFPASPQSSSNSSVILYVSPNNITNLPAGSEFTLGIQVANASKFYGWDVSVQTNPSVITPVTMNFTVTTPDLFVANYSATPTTVVKCINGSLTYGSFCGTPYNSGGPGIAHLVAALLSSPVETPPINGLVFNITYRVVSSIGFSTIQILDNATLENGTSQGILPALLGGTYGKPVPYFGISANPASPRIPEGAEGTTAVTLTSYYQFAGNVSLSLSGPALNVPGALRARLDPILLTLKPDGSNSSMLLLNATDLSQSSAYTVTITGSSVGGTGFPLTILVNVEQLPHFEMGITPDQLKIHAGLMANATVTLQSEVGFSGRVNLTLQAPTSLGVTANLGTQSVTLVSGGPALNTILTVATPLTSLPFDYVINLTAAGMGSTGPLYVVRQLTVLPPPASLAVQVNPSIITVRAGETSSATIHVTSADYFWGFLYTSAVMSGGAVGFNSSIYYIALPNSANASYTPWQSIGMTVSITADTPPGHYIVLLTVYSLATKYQRAFSTQIGIPVTVDPPVDHAANTVFGLPRAWYFGILGALAIPLIVLTVLTIRSTRNNKEDESWKT